MKALIIMVSSMIMVVLVWLVLIRIIDVAVANIIPHVQ